MGFDEDARSAFGRLRSKARALAAASSPLEVLALGTTGAYFAALTEPAPETWTRLVLRAAALVDRAQTLSRTVALDAEQRAALEFFAAIVRENADLLLAPATVRPARIALAALG